MIIYNDLYKYMGYNYNDSICHLFIEDIGTHKIVVLTELNKNHGTSITNASGGLANEILVEFKLDPGNTIWIETYEDSNIFSLISYNIDSEFGLINPKWKYWGDNIYYWTCNYVRIGDTCEAKF